MKKMIPLPKFFSVHHCPKCTKSNCISDRKYLFFVDCDGDIHEVMDVVCPNCKYEWHEGCADNQGVEKE